MENLQEVIDYLDENMTDPVPQYIFKKEIMHGTSTDKEYLKLKESKWYKQLIDEQWDNGSWGRFHTQDTKSPVKQKFVTTETALRRACELSLDKNDEMIRKSYQLMERYLLGQEEWLDTQEHFYGFTIAFRTIIAANLSLFEPRHPLVQVKKEICAVNLSKALLHGSLDEEVWEKENRLSNEILLRPFMLYVVWLLQDNDYLKQSDERCFFEYIWHRKEGMYYCAGGPLSSVQALESKGFTTWLSGLESLSDFSLFPEYMSMGTTDHLLNEVHRLMKTEVALPNAGPIFGHYSESWTKKDNRKNDLILRILRILMKC